MPPTPPAPAVPPAPPVPLVLVLVMPASSGGIIGGIVGTGVSSASAEQAAAPIASTATVRRIIAGELGTGVSWGLGSLLVTSPMMPRRARGGVD
jgi:hypothetical protein